MNVRLGFAIAVILIKPDVLLLDEVLAVGDIGFTIKCLNAVRLLTAHSSVIFVSHNMQFVSQFCSEIMVMKQGLCFLHTKEVHEGIDAYLSLFPIDANIAGTGGALISKVHLICPEILSDTLAEEPIIPQGSQVYLEFEVTNYTALQACLSIYIMDNSISPVICYYASNQAQHPLNKVPKGLTKLRVNLGSLELNAGRYSFVVAVSDPLTKQSLTRVQGICPFRIRANDVQWGQFVRIPDVVFM
jgi:lipopolysaccharide transport system ATP-binding protein